VPGANCDELVQSAMLLSATIAIASSLTGFTTCMSCDTDVSSCNAAAAAAADDDDDDDDPV